VTYALTVAALRSLMLERPVDPPLRRRRFTFSLLVVVSGELIGLAAIVYVVARLV
jgi:hypothetical protein